MSRQPSSSRIKSIGFDKIMIMKSLSVRAVVNTLVEWSPVTHKTLKSASTETSWPLPAWKSAITWACSGFIVVSLSCLILYTEYEVSNLFLSIVPIFPKNIVTFSHIFVNICENWLLYCRIVFLTICSWWSNWFRFLQGYMHVEQNMWYFD